MLRTTFEKCPTKSSVLQVLLVASWLIIDSCKKAMEAQHSSTVVFLLAWYCSLLWCTGFFRTFVLLHKIKDYKMYCNVKKS